MKLQDLDPDAQIRERVFQRIVDRTHVDPQRTAKTLFRFHLIGMIVGALLMCACAMQATPKAAIAHPQPFGLLTMMLLDSGMVGLNVVMPPYRTMAPGFALMRLSMVFMAFRLMWVMGKAWVEHEPRLIIVCTTVITISWALGPAACYLHICRKPPPPPRKTTASGSRLRTVNA